MLSLLTRNLVLRTCVLSASGLVFSAFRSLVSSESSLMSLEDSPLLFEFKVHPLLSQSAILSESTANLVSSTEFYRLFSRILTNVRCTAKSWTMCSSSALLLPTIWIESFIGQSLFSLARDHGPQSWMFYSNCLLPFSRRMCRRSWTYHPRCLGQDHLHNGLVQSQPVFSARKG